MTVVSGFSRTVSGAVVLVWLLAAQAAAQLPLEPIKDSGQGVTAAYEGWFKNPDGTFTLLIGYLNRNQKQALDIPVGPNNRIEPGGPDQGQPTHFLPRRQWGVFTVTVPANFGERTLSWTIEVNGKKTVVPMGLNPLYEVEPFKDAANNNTPPVLRFEQGGSPFQGPPRRIVATLGTTLPQPVTLTLYATDDGVVTPDRRAGESPVAVTWSLFRGPGVVTFSDAKPALEKSTGKATTTRHLQRTRRVRAPLAGQRRLGRGRRWVPVLLDQRARQGRRQGTVTGHSVPRTYLSGPPNQAHLPNPVWCLSARRPRRLA